MDDFVDGMEAHIKGLRRYALALVGNQSDADDLVQESLRRILTYVNDGETVENWRAYLYATLHNVRAGHYAKAGNRNQVSIDDYADEIACPAPQHARLEYLDLTRALARLPVDQKEVVLLVGLEGFSYREVADLLDIPLGTVMSRLSRGRAALRREMSGLPAAEAIPADESAEPSAETSAAEAPAVETGRN